MDREKRMQQRMFFVLDKIALELDQSPAGNAVTYWTQDPTEYLMLGLQNNPNIPNPREEVQIIEKLASEGLLEIKSNYSEYE